MKKIYEIIRDATYETKNKNETTQILNDKQQEFENELDMANYCNDFFINNNVKLETEIPTPLQPHILDMPVQNSMFLAPVTKNELIKHISSLKNNSAPGLDEVSAKLIKDTHSEITVPLLHIINCIFECGTVPSAFKVSVIVPIHKTGSKSDIQNYRPISMISNFAKIFEKCLKERLLSHFKKNNILSSNQFGFIEGSSTTDAMFKLTSSINECLNKGERCMAVFIDLAKAFDTVPHDKLIASLFQCGVRGIVSDVLRNYLHGRHQMVKLNGIISDRLEVQIGVPQGSVLGPILFIAYINSLLKLNINGDVISYADDTVLIFKDKTWKEVRAKVQNGLTLVKNWLQTFRLRLNLKKTNYIAFSLTLANRPPFTSIEIDTQIIKEVAHTKYLGIVIDQFLKWKSHIDYVSNKIAKLIHKFYLLREFLNKGLVVIIYKSLVESLLTYGIVVWGGLYKTNLRKLSVMQKYILKIIYRKNKRYPTQLIFTMETCNIRTLYMTAVSSYIQKNDYLKDHINHEHNTRNNFNHHINIPLSFNNSNLTFFSYIGPKVYNQLPNSIKGIQRCKKFTEKCKEYIFSNYGSFSTIFVFAK